MKSITLHNMDDKLYYHLRKKAEEKGTSLNQTIKSILEDHFEISGKKKVKNKKQFEEFLGVWGDEDLKEFQKGIDDFDKTIHSDWD